MRAALKAADWSYENDPYEDGTPYITVRLGRDRLSGITSEENARKIVAAPMLLEALRVAQRHIDHMAAWITTKNAGYSFESLGEDMPDIWAAIAKATAGAA